MEDHGGSSGLNRRLLLKTGLTGAAAAGLAAAGLQLPAQGHGSYPSRNRIINTYYDGFSYYLYFGGSPNSQQIETTFYQRLQFWIDFHWSNRGGLPSHWGAPIQLHHAGVHADKKLSNGSWSLHTYRRAIDITHIKARHTTNNSTVTVFDANVENSLYWANVASLEYVFRSVVHRRDDSAHHNHVHVDNGVSGSGLSTFGQTSSQVKFAQAACTYVWGISTAIDGGYGSQTKANTNTVLNRIGKGGYLHSSQSHWLEFCKATFRKGTGKQSY